MTLYLKQAMQLQQDNQPNEAISLYQQILSDNPNNPDALHGLGLAYAQLKDITRAIQYLKKAVTASPKTPAFHNNLGNAYKKTNQFEAALVHYFEALKLKTPYPEVHNNLGGLYCQQGKINDAILQFEKSIRMQPHRADTHYNLANCYIQNNRLLEAIPHFQKVLLEKPNHLGAMHNLGIAYTSLKQFAQAQPLLTQVVQQDGHNIDALFHLAIIEASLGNLEIAKTYYLQILDLNPKHGHTHHNLATLYLHQKKQAKALEHYRNALQCDPDNITAQHMINALTGVATKEGAPPEYICALFDQYAYNYNTHVKEQLNYQVPLLLREAISPFCSNSHSKLFTALDLGCGTGLCAPYFRDITEKLTGVDISPNMIELASKQGGYDHLIVDDIHHYLNQVTVVHHFDLIIAADVFVYFSDLKLIFKSCFNALKTSGYFVFSIEIQKNEENQENNEAILDYQSDNQPDYQLHSSGRYSHNSESIIKIANELGFFIEYQQKAILRKENNNNVWGMIFICQKPS